MERIKVIIIVLVIFISACDISSVQDILSSPKINNEKLFSIIEKLGTNESVAIGRIKLEDEVIDRLNEICLAINGKPFQLDEIEIFKGESINLEGRPHTKDGNYFAHIHPKIREGLTGSHCLHISGWCWSRYGLVYGRACSRIGYSWIKYSEQIVESGTKWLGSSSYDYLIDRYEYVCSNYYGYNNCCIKVYWFESELDYPWNY